MPYREQNRILTRIQQLWNRWGWGALELLLVIFALVTATIACISLAAWSTISFFVSPNIYTIKTEPLTLKNGQYLQVEYPNIVMGGNEPVYIRLIISGSANVDDPIEFDIALPSGITLIEPSDQAELITGTITVNEPGNIKGTQSYSIGILNSQSENSLLQRIVLQSVIIDSKSLDKPVELEMGIETYFWISARVFANSILNERSPLILLVTGFLSGAGTLVLQIIKSRRDADTAENQKRGKEYSDWLTSDPVRAISSFLDRDNYSPGYDTDFQLVERSNWEEKLPAFVFEQLRNRNWDEAGNAADVIHQLCETFEDREKPKDPQANRQHQPLRALKIFCMMYTQGNLRELPLTEAEADSILKVLKRWPDSKPFAIDLIHDLAQSRANLPAIASKLTDDSDGKKLLKDSNIQKTVDRHRAESEPGTDENKAADNIYTRISIEPNWRLFASTKNNKRLSLKSVRWLSNHGIEGVNEDFSLGFDHAELDDILSNSAVAHPTVIAIQKARISPVLVTGEEGMGKTATALLLLKHYQDKKFLDSNKQNFFPVYAALEPGIGIKDWIVEKVAHAITAFTADNPRHFLSAHESRKTAMGRLIAWNIQNMDVLRLQLYSSTFPILPSDIDQVLAYIKNIKYKRPKGKLGRGEMLNLLYLALPEPFDRICFIWDIPSSSPREEIIGQLSEVSGLALDLAAQNVVLHVFAPRVAGKVLSSSDVFRANKIDALVWDDALLRKLIDSRINQFNLVWERGIDPYDLVISASRGSPRRLIRILIRLMEFADEKLDEHQKLTPEIFNRMLRTIEEKK